MRQGFDPAREQAVLEHALEALDAAQHIELTLDQLLDRGYEAAERPAAEVGRNALRRLAAEALATAPEPVRPRLRRRIAQRAGDHEAARKALPDRSSQVSWDLIASPGPARGSYPFANAALEICEALTVAWPPVGAAHVWHPARRVTRERVEQIAATAIARGSALSTIEPLEMIAEAERQGDAPTRQSSFKLRFVPGRM